MANYLHRTTKEYRTSVDPNSLTEPESNFVVNPDISAVEGQPNKYWIITGDTVTLMDQAARDVVDADLDTSRLDSISDELDETQTIMKAFAEVVLDEINTLRDQHSLASRTLAQLKAAVRGKL